MLSVQEIAKKIAEEVDIPEEEVLAKIKRKKEELKELVSLQGAGYIVANELGVNLPGDFEKKRLLLKNVIAGMKNAEIYGWVVRIFGPRKFEREGQEGKVATLILSDGTGSIRLTLWNKQVDKYLNNIKEGTKLKAVGYIKEGKLGLEISLGKRGELEINPGVELPPLRSSINELELDQYREIRAAVTRLSRVLLFLACPICRSKLTNGKCETHGEVEPKPLMVVNALLDDGTGVIRGIFWREVAEELLEISTEAAFEYKGNVTKLIEDKREIEGKEFLFMGKASYNQVMDQKEFTVFRIKKVNPAEECEKLIQKINNLSI